jgi:hypothetical protein
MSQVRAGAELLARLDPPPEPALELEDGLVGFQLPTPVALGWQRDLREGVGPVDVVHLGYCLEPVTQAVPTQRQLQRGKWMWGSGSHQRGNMLNELHRQKGRQLSLQGKSCAAETSCCWQI